MLFLKYYNCEICTEKNMFLYILINTYRTNTSIPSSDQRVEHCLSLRTTSTPIEQNSLCPANLPFIAFISFLFFIILTPIYASLSDIVQFCLLLNFTQWNHTMYVLWILLFVYVFSITFVKISVIEYNHSLLIFMVWIIWPFYSW